MNKLTEKFFDAPTPVFTHADAAVAIAGTDFSRQGLVKRAIAAGEIINIRRGLYCLSPRYQKWPLDNYTLAQFIYGPSYISFESALRYHGWIPEAVHACTCASFGNGKEFRTPLGIFSYKRVVQRVFYTEVDRIVDPHGRVCFIASPVKALADYIYIRRLDWTTLEPVRESLRIEAHDLATATTEQLEMLWRNYKSQRVKRFLKAWKKETSK